LLKNGGRNGACEGMQEHTARLESDVEYIKRDVRDTKEDIQRIEIAINKNRGKNIHT